METTLEEVRESFELLDEWTDRYGYIIELGGELPSMDEALKVDEHKVKGCLSQVWLVARRDGDRLRLLADSDAHIVRGLVAILLIAFDGKKPEEILAVDAKAILAELGLDQHLSPGRSNGLHSMIRRIRALAEAFDES